MQGLKVFFPIINDMLLSDSSLYVAGLFDTAGMLKQVILQNGILILILGHH
jgi:hypothetical protein